MHDLPTVRRLAGLTIVILLAAACGGSGATTGVAAGPSAATSSNGITLTGATQGSITKPAGCGTALDDESSWNALMQTDAGDWMVEITIEGATAPGSYHAAWHEAGKASVWIYQGSGGASAEATTDSGTVTLDEGGKSGSLEVDVTNAEDAGKTHLSGAWVCE